MVEHYSCCYIHRICTVERFLIYMRDTMQHVKSLMERYKNPDLIGMDLDFGVFNSTVWGCCLILNHNVIFNFIRNPRNDKTQYDTCYLFFTNFQREIIHNPKYSFSIFPIMVDNTKDEDSVRIVRHYNSVIGYLLNQTVHTSDAMMVNPNRAFHHWVKLR